MIISHFHTDSSLILQVLRLECWVFGFKNNLIECHVEIMSTRWACPPLATVALTLPKILNCTGTQLDV